MKTVFCLLMIIFLAFSGYHLSFRHFKLPLVARKFYLTGIEFLFLGLLIGPEFLNIVDQKTLNGLEPLISLLLGWIGMLYGFQFELAKLRRFPVELLHAAVAEGLFTLVWMFGWIYCVLSFFAQISFPVKMAICIVLSAAAACTAQTGLALWTSFQAVPRQKMIIHLRYISGIDGMVGLLAYGAVFFFYPGTENIQPIGQFFVVAGISAGILLLYLLFTVVRLERAELVLIVVGMTVLTSGMASLAYFSSLIISFGVGVCLVNFLRDKERIFNLLVSVEKPVYLLMLLFLGLNWRVDLIWYPVAAAGYFLFRFSGKFSAGWLLTRSNPEFRPHPYFFGFGLLDWGGLPMAFLLEFSRGFPDTANGHAVSVALMALIINEALSGPLAGRLLRRDGS
ncbi:MAG: hypothetical protein RBR01_01890 [Desulfobacterales bacterium]|jgi:hypothetical protein|nr:hypothetical protein [Desulfobacterales bacterium]